MVKTQKKKPRNWKSHRNAFLGNHIKNHFNRNPSVVVVTYWQKNKTPAEVIDILHKLHITYCPSRNFPQAVPGISKAWSEKKMRMTWRTDSDYSNSDSQPVNILIKKGYASNGWKKVHGSAKKYIYWNGCQTDWEKRERFCSSWWNIWCNKKTRKFFFFSFHFGMSNIVDIWLLKFSISSHNFSQWGLQKRVRNNELVFAVAKQFLFFNLRLCIPWFLEYFPYLDKKGMSWTFLYWPLHLRSLRVVLPKHEM